MNPAQSEPIALTLMAQMELSSVIRAKLKARQKWFGKGQQFQKEGENVF